MVKIKLDVDEAGLKRAMEKKQKLINRNIKTVLQRLALPDLIDRIMIGFDRLADRADQLPEDPTNPSNWRAEFRSKLEEDLSNTFIVTGNRITVKIGEKDFLGYDPSGSTDPTDPSPLQWMVYYIEGLAGDWAFISPDIYDRFRGSGSFEQLRNRGRFGEGFLISREDFEAEGWDEIIPFDQVRHPFSGFSPLDIFTEALNEWKIRPFIQKAVDAAVQGRKL
jgi:hypothetical protein